ncbi:hypothetical protein [Bradyrhizobium canariense]|uniref:Uncharacterized protein n=1 Tax=Bradyrhizobium canariense TaxID=255045 RepID=A0A1X3H889_9BRAD|nr:hypothetical protein [Bradyrhizobium canariense]OSI71256.1 hypothetical protein BSZ22_12160 [Bradyrhizobium canariense]OSI80263.1 hypothetical protein BSZ23_11890 [Bradyrhizobium canariense]OSI91970.1 hypothetical protein BSZ24_16165 [Bradyrhizobium canariense]OSI93047.1 hypothetical protein BSZ25_10895 [Bradyrhizobium canariense]OSJ05989.1 hypothetical protein BSZ16_11280 [Bradyrhizobium canariense]
MHMPSITADRLAVLILFLICAGITLPMIRPRRSGQTIFNAGILLAFVLSIACALPVLPHLSWAGFIDEMADQAVAAIQFLEVAYVILTL